MERNLLFVAGAQHKAEVQKHMTQMLEKESALKTQKVIRNSFIGGFAIVALFSMVVVRQKKRIAIEKRRSDDLLHNILPEETAEELKVNGSAEAKSYDLVTVMFTDADMSKTWVKLVLVLHLFGSSVEQRLTCSGSPGSTMRNSQSSGA